MTEQIKMVKTTPGAINSGLNVKLYAAGLVYDTNEMMPSVVETFLKIGVAIEHVKSEEVVRHEKGLTGAPENKRIEVEEVKEELSPEEIVDEAEEAVVFTAEELEGKTAGEIRELAKKFGVDLSDFHRRTSAIKLAEAYLERQ